MLNLSAFISGLVFAIGLAIAQMTLPQKIIGFLNLSGNWDPSLLLVLCSAVSVYATGYFILKKSSSVKLPDIKTHIDKRLVFGSALFGIGWGMVGLCPGPALVGLVTGNVQSLVFIGSLSLTMFIVNYSEPKENV